VANWYVNSGASGANNGTSWTNAYTAFGSAVTAATSDNDVILVHYTHQENLGADTTYTFAAANIQVYSVDKDSSDALTAMGTGGWIGHNSASRSITILGGRQVFIYGITLRQASNISRSYIISGGDNSQTTYNTCYFWLENTNTGCRMLFGSGDVQCKNIFVNCTFRFGATAQSMQPMGLVEFIGGSISSAGSAITTIFLSTTTIDGTGATVDVLGFDFSAASSTATILGDQTILPVTLTLRQCKLPTSATYLATQTNKNQSSGKIFCIDCSAGATQNFYLYQDALGVLQTNTAITYTGESQSWKIDTTADCTPFIPFVLPWIGLWNTSTSSLTPRFEILRDGSATAYDNDEVWGEFSAKITGSSTLGAQYTDRMAYLGTPAAQDTGAGLSSWAGETTTGAPDAWSGKVDSGAALTPAETGPIMGRVVVGVASSTVYISPTIRTA
jgi:hypothetical protein